jgi:hypothetical protein
MSLLAQKSLLAKLMATENLTIRQSGVSTASFDVLNRVLTVPILDHSISKELYDLFMGHEVGHALYTPLEQMRKARDEGVNMSVLNVVEDSRIERKIKNKYPGIRNPFIKAYRELYENNFFETQGKDITKYNLIDKINLHCKIGASLALPFNDEERELLRQVETTETYEDAIRVTKLICDVIQKQLDEMPEMETVSVAVPADGDSEDEEESQSSQGKSDENADSGDGKSDESDSEGEKPTQSNSSVQSDEVKGESEQKTESDTTGNGADIGNWNTEVRSYTDDAYRENEDRLFTKENIKYVYANVPKYDTSKIMDYKTVYAKYKDWNTNIPLKEFAKYRQESNKVVSYLVKEFELRKNAEQMKRASTAKTGELDLNRIYSYRFSEDIFKKLTVTPNGKSHGLVMFLDWSGSMHKHIGNTVKQLLNLVMFCKKVNIPFEVYSFLDQTEYEYMYKQQSKDGDLYMNQFGLLNILSSRMNASEFSTAGASLLYIAGVMNHRGRVLPPDFMYMNGTPLNETVIAAMEIVPQFQKRNNLQIVNTVFLTDGEGSMLTGVVNNYGSSYTHMTIRDPKNRHEEVWDKTGKTFSDASWGQTNALIRLLKARTNSHVIGFYVCESRDLSHKMYSFFPHMQQEKDYAKKYQQSESIKTEFRNKSYCIVNSTGFDDYYLLRSNGLDTDDDEELSFKDNATTRGMVSAFSKHAGKKINNRVVLNRFIDLIS